MTARRRPQRSRPFAKMMLTSCRLSELHILPWDHVDSSLPLCCEALPDTSRWAHQVVYLVDPAIAVLERIETRDGNPWVIGERKTASHRADAVTSLAAYARKQPGSIQVPIHDLRPIVSPKNPVCCRLASILFQCPVRVLMLFTQVQTTGCYAHNR